MFRWQTFCLLHAVEAWFACSHESEARQANFLFSNRDRRNDAGLAAAELMLAVEEHVLASGSVDTVGTTGRCYRSPVLLVRLLTGWAGWLDSATWRLLRGNRGCGVAPGSSEQHTEGGQLDDR